MVVPMEEKQKLKFHLDPKGGVPYYKQIITQVQMAIADGRLFSGDQLPTVRALAVDLKINPNTVARAYNELEIRGLVNTQQGTGTFISDKEVTLSEVEKEKLLQELTRSLITKAYSYGISRQEILDYMLKHD